MNERKTVYITKYALTDGIIRADAMLIDGGKYASSIPNGRFFVSRREYHLTLDDAHAHVREMIAARRKSIAKALVKLDQQEKALAAGTFKVVEK